MYETYGSLWSKRYSQEYERMCRKVAITNACAKTITRKITPEEQEYYESLLEKAKKDSENFERERRRYFKYVDGNR